MIRINKDTALHAAWLANFNPQEGYMICYGLT